MYMYRYVLAPSHGHVAVPTCLSGDVLAGLSRRDVAVEWVLIGKKDNK